MPKAKKVKARHSFCWHCSKKLYAGGWFYRTVVVDGVEHVVHVKCERQMTQEAK